MQAPASPAGLPKLIYKHIQSLQVQIIQHRIWCHSCSHRTMHRVMGTVVTLCIMSKALLSCHAWCHECCHCMAVVGVMLQSHLLSGHGGCHHTMLCHGHGCWVMVGVITLCCVTVRMGVSCYMMSQSQLLCCMVVL